jgi:REP element-mobilizing transposase RayT
MLSYNQILYHIIFRTKNSKRSLNQAEIKSLFAYALGIVKNLNCHLYRINGVEDHIHMLSSLHPQVALADFMRTIKMSTSLWLKSSGKFPEFDGWGEGYAALTYSWKDKDVIIEYIKNQHAHHSKCTYAEEVRKLLKEFGVEIDERYFP